MRSIKKTLVWTLTVIFLLNILMVVPASAASTSTQPTTTRPSGTLINNQVLNNLGIRPQIPKIALDAIKRGVKPAALEDVTWTLDENVELLSDEAIQSIKSNVRNGIVDVSHLSGIRPENEKIYVDKISGATLQFVGGTDNKTYLYAAKQDSLVTEITIPDQSVRLNDANISSVNENVAVIPLTTYSSDSTPSQYEIKFNKDVSVSGVDGTKNTVGVRLSGSLFINAPTLDAKYTKWDGYKFIYRAGERAEVSAELYADVKTEVKVPLLGFDIPSDICGVTVGVFLVIGVDGKITLSYSFQQHYDITAAGVQGGTWYYIPTSLDGVLTQDFGFDSNGVDISGEIKGDIYLSAEVGLKILGKVSIDISIKLGMTLDVKLDTGNPDSFRAKADGYFSINARVKIFSKDWKKELYSYHFLLFDKTQKPKSNYIIGISEACAYRDIIKGRVEKQTGPDTKIPYVGPLTLSVTGIGGSGNQTIDVNTDENGDFTANHNLVNGSKVAVKIPGSANLWSEPVLARFPFSNIAIDEADYYKGIVTGYVSQDDENALFYTGPVKIYLINKENIPITASKVLTVPENQTVVKQVNCTNGKFRATIRDLDPFDMVLAYIDYDGFNISSNLTETEGLTFNVTGDYVQQPDKLLTKGRTIVLGGSYYINKSGNPSRNLPQLQPVLPNILTGIVEPTGEIIYKVSITYPHGQTSKNVIEKEWKLTLSKTTDGAITATAGPWELDLPSVQPDPLRPLSPLLLSRGDSLVQYHVQEIIEYFYKGKKIEIANEALDCDYERASEGIGLPNILGRKVYDLPWDDMPTYNTLPGRINPQINPELGMSSFLFGLNIDTNNSAVTYSANINNKDSTAATAQRQSSSNFSCRVQLKKYESVSDRTPETSSWNLMVNGNNLKITSGNTSILLLRDLKRKIYLNNEFHTATAARYDGDDYIPELSKIGFSKLRPQSVNGQMCNVYEKKGSNTVLRICELKDKEVPISVTLTKNGTKIEMVFSNYVYNRVTSQDMSY